ncbi:hypothetical protein RM844_28610 [Streptomyces sp. DSM 44915]|uniref:Uncharacterized protein n=1 Tax=Streptomyces chisholmiae TaxID=3075540 RepID=A0ABU2JZ45_9ACTN|nr:hypothetical protein [Streptomyces sp. DSM 44915]MDT0270239.1 hypothetical protein [Streptomyces sp. DSM 44915]
MAPPDHLLTPVPDNGEHAVVRDLAAALAAHGITLPSLRLDTLTATRTDTTPMIELGRIGLPVAQQLVHALEAGPAGATATAPGA